LTSWAAVSFSRTASYSLISLDGSLFHFLRLSILLNSLGQMFMCFIWFVCITFVSGINEHEHDQQYAKSHSTHLESVYILLEYALSHPF
jgi:hypothetical protein